MVRSLPAMDPRARSGCRNRSGGLPLSSARDTLTAMVGHGLTPLLQCYSSGSVEHNEGQKGRLSGPKGTEKAASKT
jgi:hypothetical protein